MRHTSILQDWCAHLFPNGGVQMTPELLVSQVLMKEKKQKKEVKTSEEK